MWRSIYSVVLFMVAFAYLKPYVEKEQSQFMQRVNRCLLMLTLLYMSFLIVMLNLRPEQGRALLGYLDTSLN